MSRTRPFRDISSRAAPQRRASAAIEIRANGGPGARSEPPTPGAGCGPAVQPSPLPREGTAVPVEDTPPPPGASVPAGAGVTAGRFGGGRPRPCVPSPPPQHALCFGFYRFLSCSSKLGASSCREETGPPEQRIALTAAGKWAIPQNVLLRLYSKDRREKNKRTGVGRARGRRRRRPAPTGPVFQPGFFSFFLLFFLLFFSPKERLEDLRAQIWH